MDSYDDILWSNERTNVCIHDVFYGNDNEPCRSRAVAEDAAANSDVQDIADTQSAAEDNGFASNGGGDMSTEDLSDFDSSGSGGDFGGDFEF
ncbi:MAG: hypothetical protein ACJ703_09295 [Nitrososphaera sp.]